MTHQKSLWLLMHAVLVISDAVNAEPTLSDLRQVRCTSDQPFICLPYGVCCTGSEFCHSGLCESCFPMEIPEGQRLTWCREVGQFNVSLMRSDACRLACQDSFSSAELAATCGSTQAPEDKSISVPTYDGARSEDGVTDFKCTPYMEVMITSLVINFALVFVLILTLIRNRRSGNEHKGKQKRQDIKSAAKIEDVKAGQRCTKSTPKTIAAAGDSPKCTTTNNKFSVHSRHVSPSGEPKSFEENEEAVRLLHKSGDNELNRSCLSPVSNQSSTTPPSVPPVDKTKMRTSTEPVERNNCCGDDVVINVDLETESPGCRESQSENSRISAGLPTSDDNVAGSGYNETATPTPWVERDSLSSQLVLGPTEGPDIGWDNAIVARTMTVTDNGSMNDVVQLESDKTTEEHSATRQTFEESTAPDNPSLDNPSSEGYDEVGEGNYAMPPIIYNETLDLNKKNQLRGRGNNFKL